MPVLHVEAVTGRLDAEDPHVAIVEERMEEANGIGPATDAGDDGVGQSALGRHDLLACFLADDGLEVAHHGRIGVRSSGGADDVVGVADVGDPVAQRLVHRVLECARA